jgi:hypothetical protein
MIRLLFLIGWSSFLFAKVVCIVPFHGCGIDSLFYSPGALRDEIGKPFYKLREGLERKGYEVKFTADGRGVGEADAVISFEADPFLLTNLSKLGKDRRLLFCFEPPVVVPGFYDRNLTRYFGKIFVMFDDFVDNREYFKFCYPQPRLEMRRPSVPFEVRKLCAMIAGNKDSAHPQSLYGERRKAIQFFEKLSREGVDDFDLFGTGWDGWPLWRGTVGKKWDAYGNYRFAICYENMREQRGYITEKIFDALVAGCVPVYLGAENIGEYVPETCFIDRRKFSSDEALYRFLKEMGKEEHARYLDAIESYLRSAKASRFSVDAFVELVLSHLP